MGGPGAATAAGNGAATGGRGATGMGAMGPMGGAGAGGKGDEDEERLTKFMIEEDRDDLFGLDVKVAPPNIGE